MINVKTIYKLYFEEGDEPVGYRIQRGPPLPVTRFDFETIDEAEKAKKKLESYIMANQPKTKKKK